MLRSRGSSIPSLVDTFFGDDFLSNFFDNTNLGTVPAVNIIESKDDFAIEVAAPGLEKKDFNVDVHNNVLTISSQKEFKDEQRDEKVMRREFSYTAFKRSFSLPDGADSDKIKASYKDGILTVTIPKKEEAKEKPARQISIS
ncbi:MAG: Hsp20/alpha crystallin family protein [Tenuifilaceae bacterium]|nr:Hsp20/alpha crystallin family protein [Tenuifilaceae bacterium]